MRMPANTAVVSVEMILHSHAAPPGSPRDEVKMGEEAATPARGAAEGGKDGRKVAVQYGDDLDFLKELMDEDVVKESDVKDIVRRTPTHVRIAHGHVLPGLLLVCTSVLLVCKPQALLVPLPRSGLRKHV